MAGLDKIISQKSGTSVKYRSESTQNNDGIIRRFVNIKTMSNTGLMSLRSEAGQTNSSVLTKALKTLYPDKTQTHTFSQTKLTRPPLPEIGRQSPPVSRYSPNKDFTKVNNRA